MTETSMICLYFGIPEECQNCGGWTKAEGGPFPGDDRFCSLECFEDAMELTSRRAQQFATAWCPACGYDNHEHAPDCAASVTKRQETP
jgi:hypothetical protein